MIKRSDGEEFSIDNAFYHYQGSNYTGCVYFVKVVEGSLVRKAYYIPEGSDPESLAVSFDISGSDPFPMSVSAVKKYGRLVFGKDGTSPPEGTG